MGKEGTVQGGWWTGMNGNELWLDITFYVALTLKSLTNLQILKGNS